MTILSLNSVFLFYVLGIGEVVCLIISYDFQEHLNQIAIQENEPFIWEEYDAIIKVVSLRVSLFFLVFLISFHQ